MKQKVARRLMRMTNRLRLTRQQMKRLMKQAMAQRLSMRQTGLASLSLAYLISQTKESVTSTEVTRY